MKAVAVGLCLVLLGGSTARAYGAQYKASGPPPDVYAPLDWVWDDVSYSGYWFDSQQVQKIEMRLHYLEDKAALECFNKTQEANKQLLLGKPLVIGGIAIAVGLVAGILIGTKL